MHGLSGIWRVLECRVQSREFRGQFKEFRALSTCTTNNSIDFSSQNVVIPGPSPPECQMGLDLRHGPFLIRTLNYEGLRKAP